MSDVDASLDPLLPMVHAVPPPYIIDRREPLPTHDPAALRARLTQAQRAAVDALASAGWRLAFVRRPAHQSPIAVLLDADGLHFVVVRADGSLDEDPTLQVRV